MLVYRGGVRAPVALICQYIDSRKADLGAWPICRVLTESGIKIAPSTYYARRSRPPRSGLLHEESGGLRDGRAMCARPWCARPSIWRYAGARLRKA